MRKIYAKKACKIRIHKNKTYVYVIFYNNAIFTKLKIEHIMLIEINGFGQALRRAVRCGPAQRNIKKEEPP